ncbi:hypothetical protein F8388_013420 [Cannabis sativa]|uniref:F-box domain-containing protein n=1 Tax=Cannabis sativa TaxID=3483 RepID=A0A7J6EXK7_CANSA|nr:hypothetical protein F8388_013420 [Cannabis sativa]
MASSSTEPSPSPSPPKEVRNWLELPRDVTASILSCLGAIEILKSGQMVCKLWLDICKDPLMWRTIDIRKNGDPDDFLDFRSDVQKMYRYIIDRSCGQIVDISIEDFRFDQQLLYITASSRQIKRLRLASCSFVSDNELVEAIEKLPLLEELDLTQTYFKSPESCMEALGRCCPHFKTLKLNSFVHKVYVNPSYGKDYSKHAIAIGKYLPGLHHLELIGSWMTNIGLEAILDGCPKLESLDLRGCFNIRLKEYLGRRCAEQIKHVKLPYDSLKGTEFISDIGETFSEEDYNLNCSHHFFSMGNNSAELEDENGDDDSDYDFGYSSEDDFLDNDDSMSINYDYDDFLDYDDFTAYDDDDEDDDDDTDDTDDDDDDDTDDYDDDD